MYTSKSSLEVAVEAAARVDAVLAKKGKIKPNPIAAVVNHFVKICLCFFILVSCIEKATNLLHLCIPFIDEILNIGNII